MHRRARRSAQPLGVSQKPMPSTNEEALKVGDVGSFEALSRKPNPDRLVLDYIPPIEAMLARAVQLKGEALTEHQIALIRAHSDVMAIPAELAEAAKSRAAPTPTPNTSLERTRDK